MRFEFSLGALLAVMNMFHNRSLDRCKTAGRHIEFRGGATVVPFGGFETVVDRYEKETGNKVTLDVTPYPGMLQKSRDAVRGSESIYDLVNLDTHTSTRRGDAPSKI